METVLNSTFCYKLLNALGFAACLFMGQNYSINSNLAYIFPKKSQQRCGVLRDCDASNQWGQVV